MSPSLAMVEITLVLSLWLRVKEADVFWNKKIQAEASVVSFHVPCVGAGQKYSAKLEKLSLAGRTDGC